MQCLTYGIIREEVFQNIALLPNDIGTEILSNSHETLSTLLRKHNGQYDIEQVAQVWIISAKYTSRIYRLAVRKRLDLS